VPHRKVILLPAVYSRLDKRRHIVSTADETLDIQRLIDSAELVVAGRVTELRDVDNTPLQYGENRYADRASSRISGWTRRSKAKRLARSTNILNKLKFLA
jgi:hypothetical protein